MRKKVTLNVLEMIQEGQSLNKISKETGLNKSTVYYHYKKIKGKKIKEIAFSFKNQDELGEFLGVFSGDGNLTINKRGSYDLRISIGAYESGYADYLYQKMGKWFGKFPQKITQDYKGNPSVIILRYRSKKIYNLLQENLTWEGKKTYSIQLKQLDLYNTKFNRGFLRGLIDTDGSYYRKRKRLTFSSTSYLLARQAYLIITSNIGIRPAFYTYKKEGRATLYTIELYKAKAEKVIKCVKPMNPSKKLHL